MAEGVASAGEEEKLVPEGVASAGEEQMLGMAMPVVDESQAVVVLDADAQVAVGPLRLPFVHLTRQ